ncbi:glycoside hydrolase family 43 protein [Mucilaginibacter daejeonensis]|uniref:glycoside hydrolase family 43 protein n=1 Tax=Mucilaginibacter daejeonensis TaxID=398049 RepID=UPI001D1778BC|nr:glycoside hydrolase family 43 protein [Mucilaginibacter daejeonensis]UEG52260.1 glycoside hydrolase family 43 protein [Mucilaginibacter daejeonensis]
MLKKLLIALLITGSAQLTTQAQTKVNNPILAGFYPDPSIVKVNKDYYLVNSSFAYFPGIPVFHSQDLKNWKQISNVIDRPTQMNFMGDRVTRGLFAPAINYHNGTYYITCTQIDQKGNFLMSSKDPAGPWSDPIWLPQVRGIDPSLFFDGDKAYIIYNGDAPDNKPLYSGHRTIRMHEIDPLTGKLIGDNQVLVNGGVDLSKKPVWIEGPHVMKVGDWYYLYAAEGGTSVNHSEVVFRSKAVNGPYVPYEHNPILTQRDLPADRKDPITSAGHAEFVTGPDGRTYAVFLAVRPYEGNYYNTGRETFLAPVTWKNEWPVVDLGGPEIPYTFELPYKTTTVKGLPPLNGNFSYRTRFENGIDGSCLFLRTYEPGWLTFNKADGLVMKIRPETCMGKGHPSFIGKRQQHMRCEATTTVRFNPAKPNEKAGLLAFQDEHHFYFACRSKDSTGKAVVQLYRSPQKGETMELMTERTLTTPNAELNLRIKADGARYSFEYSEGGQPWKMLDGNVDGKFLSTQVAGGFIGSLFALYGTSSGEASNNKAIFRSFTYSGNDSVYK